MNTYWPCWPVCTAGVGTTMACGSVISVTETLTNCPGQRCRVSFGNVPLIRIVPVVGSTALSTNVILPTERRAGVVRRQRLDLHRPLRHVALQLRQPRLRDAERDVNRRHLVDDHERRHVVGADQVALVDHQRAGPARRCGAAIVAYWSWTVAFSTVARSASRRRLERRRRRHRRVDLLLGGDAARRQILISAAPGTCALAACAVSRWKLARAWLERRFERPAVEREEHLALL